jgi:hypothetical protein
MVTNDIFCEVAYINHPKIPKKFHIIKLGMPVCVHTFFNPYYPWGWFLVNSVTNRDFENVKAVTGSENLEKIYGIIRI